MGTRWHDEGAVVVPADEERLDVGLEGADERALLRQLAPRLEREQRLRRAGRARVEGDGPVQVTLPEEERHADRHLQRVPLGVGELEVRVVQVPVGHGAEAALAPRPPA